MDEYIERLAEAVHKAYCKQYKKKYGKDYWTKGNYSLLDEETKEFDRAIVWAVLETIEKWIRFYKYFW